MRKKTLVLASILIVALVSVAFASSIVLWQKSIHHGMKVIGIAAILTPPDANSYVAQTEALDLTNNKVWLSIVAEAYYYVWLNVTVISNNTAMVPSLQGQYVDVVYSSGTYQYTLVGSPFVIPMDAMFQVDKTQMVFKVPGTGTHGYALQLTFTFDTENCLPGDIDMWLYFSMGFV
jgi:hypothetical protein